MPFPRTSVYWYCGERLKNCVWMSMAALPLLLRDVTIASIAVAASALAAATVLPVVSTPRFSIARSGSSVTLPSRDTQMPEFPLVACVTGQSYGVCYYLSCARSARLPMRLRVERQCLTFRQATSV